MIALALAWRYSGRRGWMHNTNFHHVDVEIVLLGVVLHFAEPLVTNSELHDNVGSENLVVPLGGRNWSIVAIVCLKQIRAVYSCLEQGCESKPLERPLSCMARNLDPMSA